jgi:alanyl-tRNA synthetase
VTERLYYADSSMLQFEATVVRTASLPEGLCEVVLDRTCFYPGGGGQPCDLGTLDDDRVLEVREQNEEIVHVVSNTPTRDRVRGLVDKTRRRDFMIQHTGQHIFSQALVRAGKLETVSVHLGDDDTTIELKADGVDDEVLRKAEQIANEVVRENRRVIHHEVDRAEISKFSLRRTPPDEGRLRIVEVDAYDWAACGGVHVATSGEVFLLKVVSQERIRGRVRIHLMIGDRAFADYGRKVALTQGLSQALTCGEDSILVRVKEMLASERNAARELRKLRTEQASEDADASVAGAKKIGDTLLIRRVFDGRGPEYVKAFVERVVTTPGRIGLAADRGKDSFLWLIAHSLGDRLELSTIVTKHFGVASAKGGGRGGRMQGVGARVESLELFVDAIEGELAKALGEESE